MIKYAFHITKDYLKALLISILIIAACIPAAMLIVVVRLSPLGIPVILGYLANKRRKGYTIWAIATTAQTMNMALLVLTKDLNLYILGQILTSIFLPASDYSLRDSRRKFLKNAEEYNGKI